MNNMTQKKIKIKIVTKEYIRRRKIYGSQYSKSIPNVLHDLVEEYMKSPQGAEFREVSEKTTTFKIGDILRLENEKIVMIVKETKKRFYYSKLTGEYECIKISSVADLTISDYYRSEIKIGKHKGFGWMNDGFFKKGEELYKLNDDVQHFKVIKKYGFWDLTEREENILKNR